MLLPAEYISDLSFPFRLMPREAHLLYIPQRALSFLVCILREDFRFGILLNLMMTFWEYLFEPTTSGTEGGDIDHGQATVQTKHNSMTC